MRAIALDTNTYAGFKRGDPACVEVFQLPTNDLWIAATCVEHGAVLFSFDAHFDQVAGLRRITSWAEALP